MTQSKDSYFYKELQEKLLACGIILVGLPALKNASLNGATRRFKNGSILLLLTDRNKRSDIFWFSLFHELGHIIHGDFHSDIEDKEAYRAKEDKADIFAQNLLIPVDSYREFVEKGDFSKHAIETFAQEIKIHASIVLGRLQKEKLVDYHKYSELKINYNMMIKQATKVEE